MTNSLFLMETSSLFTCRLLLSVLLESAQSQFIQSVVDKNGKVDKQGERNDLWCLRFVF